MRRTCALALAAAAVLAGPVQALTAHELSTVGARPRIGARLPLDTAFRDDAGRPTTLGRALGGEPAVLVFADYRCRSLCGPGLVLTALALDQTGLRPGRDYRFVVVGLDAADPPQLAASLRRARLQSPAGRAAILLGGGRADRVADAAGYRYLFDPALGQYAHDTVVFALDPQGRVRTGLSEFTLESSSLRAALTGTPTAGSMFEQVRQVCHGIAADVGKWNAPVSDGLRTVAAVFLLLMGAGLAGALAWRRWA